MDAIRPFEHFSEERRRLRNRLRARQAGDQRKPTGEQEIDQLTQELAYEYWHRMLFTHFLAENHLLMHPDGVAVSLAECDELAKLEGADNGWVLAARYASRMLPQIFRGAWWCAAWDQGAAWRGRAAYRTSSGGDGILAGAG